VESVAGLTAALGGAGVSVDLAQAGSIDAIKTFVTQARALKAEGGVASRRDIKLQVSASDDSWAALLPHLSKLLRMAGAEAIARGPGAEGMPATVTTFGRLYLDAGSAIDPAAEKLRLSKEIEKLKQHIAGTEARLANEAFVSKAPPAVLEGARKQLADLKSKLADTVRLMENLAG